jgi:hypothetical protein
MKLAGANPASATADAPAAVHESLQLTQPNR